MGDSAGIEGIDEQLGATNYNDPAKTRLKKRSSNNSAGPEVETATHVVVSSPGESLAGSEVATPVDGPDAGRQRGCETDDAGVSENGSLGNYMIIGNNHEIEANMNNAVAKVNADHMRKMADAKRKQAMTKEFKDIMIVDGDQEPRLFECQPKA